MKSTKKAQLKVLRAKDLKANLKAVPKLLKLNLGAGDGMVPDDRKDYEGVDIVKLPKVKWVVDLFKFPWPWKNDSVSDVYAQQFFEHVPAKIRPKFMDELWRVMAEEGRATFVTPYYSSMRSIQDYTHEWPPICEASYYYFNEQWRRMNHLEHMGVKCNFDFTWGYGIIPEFAQKPEETRQFAVNHYVNACADLIVTLIKKPLLPKQ